MSRLFGSIFEKKIDGQRLGLKSQDVQLVRTFQDWIYQRSSSLLLWFSPDAGNQRNLAGQPSGCQKCFAIDCMRLPATVLHWIGTVMQFRRFRPVESGTSPYGVMWPARTGRNTDLVSWDVWARLPGLTLWRRPFDFENLTCFLSIRINCR
jgi:hypothetical protein